jgi:hypothetical protein
MSGPFIFEGNIYGQYCYITNSTLPNNFITNSVINTSSLDMLSTSGQYQRITNVATPILANDAVIKSYVDSLQIVFTNITLTGTNGSLISSDFTGSFIVTITNLVNGGPSAIFNITKNNSNVCGQILRTVSCPGLSPTCMLDMRWPSNSGPILFKTNVNYDGSYTSKKI